MSGWHAFTSLRWVYDSLGYTTTVENFKPYSNVSADYWESQGEYLDFD